MAWWRRSSTSGCRGVGGGPTDRRRPGCWPPWRSRDGGSTRSWWASSSGPCADVSSKSSWSRCCDDTGCGCGCGIAGIVRELNERSDRTGVSIGYRQRDGACRKGLSAGRGHEPIRCAEAACLSQRSRSRKGDRSSQGHLHLPGSAITHRQRRSSWPLVGHRQRPTTTHAATTGHRSSRGSPGSTSTDDSGWAASLNEYDHAA